MKIAVIFPGIGYHVDKPLLYYSKKIVRQQGYEIVEVPYGNFPKDVKGSKKKMKKAFESAAAQTEEILKKVDFPAYEEILFISKSVGTVVAAYYAKRHGLKTRNVFFTPVEASFEFMDQDGIVFYGTADPWSDAETVRTGCEKKGYPLYITENGNHSLETGDALEDLHNLTVIMETVKEYILRKNSQKIL